MPSSEPPPLPDAPLPRRFVELVATRGVSEVRREARDVEMQRKLDAFQDAMSGPYRLPDGRSVRVPAPFEMSTRYDSQEKTMAALEGERRAAAARAHLSPGTVTRIEAGRGTPEEIRRLTQALIDVHHLAPGEQWGPDTVRRLMFDAGIGIDCAGYVQQAYLEATGLTRSQAGFTDVLDEDLSHPKGFTRIASLADARPGDIFVLGSPPCHRGDGLREPGHRVILYDQHLASAADLNELWSHGSAAHDFSTGASLRVFDVDSSWGCGGEPMLGGVHRERWWLDEKTGRWAYVEHRWDAQHRGQVDRFVVSATPYDHPFEGVIRKEGP